MSNRLIGIVQCTGELVAKQAIATADYKGTTITVEVIADVPLNVI
jgi:hypothetical protein